ncbi:AraC family ligand binding domain-containing protein [Novosphingobium sp. 2638]|uniref:AraC family ligand binding domain-containing protein n=2 Tax=Novosphingobium beihaiensis TaxID=2930389 RepID=A0ABT0BRD6_9SPHN|nr:AraC family ligand binding domain-containing protein [Novosphingobium beihaiensis]
MKVDFDQASAGFAPLHAMTEPDAKKWAPVLISKAQIDAEIERLASLPNAEAGRRSSLIVHPDALPGAPGLAPGICVTLSVLKPGERTEPFRHNATEVNFCIRGQGRAVVAGRAMAFRQYDVWNTPSYAIYTRENDGDDLQVMLTYNNSPVLKFMNVYFAEHNPPMLSAVEEAAAEEEDGRKTSPYGTFQIGDDGAMLMPYERLINPPAVEANPLFWPWEKVEAELGKLADLGQNYVGRRLYLLYNPMTGRTNGTTPSFFSTITIRPPRIVDRPHRHTSAAINYYFKGSGRSSVAGNVYEWSAGDLMLSAPGWAVHNHASYDDYVYELTVQDQPLNIAMESLLWQESMKEPPILLGTHAGFDTNRAVVG